MKQKQIITHDGHLVTKMDLFFHDCPCGELCMDGCWQDLAIVRRYEWKIAVSSPSCPSCGRGHVRTFRLTTSKRRRLFYWTNVWASVADYLPFWLAKKAAGWTLWLDRHVRF